MEDVSDAACVLRPDGGVPGCHNDDNKTDACAEEVDLQEVCALSQQALGDIEPARRIGMVTHSRLHVYDVVFLAQYLVLRNQDPLTRAPYTESQLRGVEAAYKRSTWHV